ESAEAHFLLGKAYGAKQKYHAALSEYELARKYGMDDYDLHSKISESALYLMDFERALKEAEICLSRRKDDPMVYFILGNIRAEKK
ncbi:MAG: hypothetical protein COZ95_02495, partial [Nitrospirae bacterium CG_4_8_14_3_um_filter_50_41]